MKHPNEPILPAYLKECLGSFGVQFGDETFPTAWGFRIWKRLGEEKWAELSKYGSTEFVSNGYDPMVGSWYLITYFLTREEAIEMFGAITKEVFGPRGGWRSVTFGTKTFYSRQFKTTRDESPAPITEA